MSVGRRKVGITTETTGGFAIRFPHSKSSPILPPERVVLINRVIGQLPQIADERATYATRQP
jgi:hypothetical protein